MVIVILLGFPGGSDGKESACNTDFDFPHPMDLGLKGRIVRSLASTFRFGAVTARSKGGWPSMREGASCTVPKPHSTHLTDATVC